MSKEKIRLYQWEAHPNFGDQISKVIVEGISKNKVKIVSSSESNKLLAVGSILQFAKNGDILWGTGLHPNPKLLKLIDSLKKLDVRAVRGPITRDFLLKKGISCPKIYGDPGILMPLIYPKKPKPKKEYGIIPHIFERKLFENFDYIDGTENWKKVINQILKCKKIISSSLHGIIIAEAYGIPAVWLKSKSREDLKYIDYYRATGRNIKPVTSLKEAIKSKGNLLPSFDRRALINSFPKELVNNRFNILRSIKRIKEQYL